MPLVGLGTWKSAPGDVKNAVLEALKAGYRHIDCAAVYGNEKEVGEAFKEAFEGGVCKRKDVFVTSKLWINRCFPEEVEGALAKTLSDLGLQYLDLYLIHWPLFWAKEATFPPTPEQRLPYSVERYMAVWRELEKAFDAGKVKAIGVSNMSVKKLEDIWEQCRIKPAVNQVELHPYLAQPELLNWCTRHGMRLTAYSPLGSPDRPGGAESTDPAPLHDHGVKALADKYNVSPAQILIRWSVERGVPVIPKSVTPARIRSNFDVWGFRLDADDMAKLDALNCGGRLIRADFIALPGDDWRVLWDMEYQPKL